MRSNDNSTIIKTIYYDAEEFERVVENRKSELNQNTWTSEVEADRRICTK